MRSTTDTFEALPTHDQAAVIREASFEERRALLRELDPHHAADVLQQFDRSIQEELLALLQITLKKLAPALLNRRRKRV